MKDSFGGTIMYYILFVFLAVYIVFIALTLRFAQAFRIKNKIIDFIETYDGYVITSNLKNDINDYLNNSRVRPNSVTIELINNKSSNYKHEKNCFYRVSTSITWEWPFLNAGGTWVINGETKNVKNCNADNASNGRVIIP